MRIIKKSIAIFICFCMTFLLIPGSIFAVTKNSNISAITDKTNIYVGDYFTVILKISEMNVSTFAGGISYDASVVQNLGYEGVDEDHPENIYLIKQDKDEQVAVSMDEVGNDIDGNTFGFIKTGTEESRYAAIDGFIKIRFKAIAAGDAKIRIFEDSDGTDGHNVSDIHPGFNINVSKRNINYSATVDKRTIQKGEYFTVILDTEAMEVANFSGGISFNSHVVKFIGCEGILPEDSENLYLKNEGIEKSYTKIDKSGVFLQNDSFYFEKNVTSAKRYDATNGFVKVLFRGIGEGNADIRLFETSDGICGCNVQNINPGFEVNVTKHQPNISAITSDETIEKGDYFTITLGTSEMEVATFAGGLSFDSEIVQFEGYVGANEDEPNQIYLIDGNDKKSYIKIDEAGVSSNGNSFGFIKTGSSDKKYAASENLVQVMFRAKKTGDACIRLFEDSDGVNGCTEENIDPGFKVEVIPRTTNLTASVSTESVEEGKLFTVILNTSEMSVSTFAGGISFNPDVVKIIDFKGIKPNSDKKLFLLYGENNSIFYDEISSAEVGKTGDVFGFIRIATEEKNFLQTDAFATITFKAIGTGNANIRLFEDSDGFSGCLSENLDPGFDVQVLPSSAKYNLGDVDESGQINAMDITCLARHVAKLNVIENHSQLLLCDVNGDGRISAEDITHLARFVAKLINELDGNK